MFLGQFKSAFKEDEEPKAAQKPVGQQKSSSAEDFLKTGEAKEFVSDWVTKQRDGKPVFTRRGITDLLATLFQVPGLDTNSKIITAADKILMKLGNMDGLQGFLMGWKAKSEGLIRGLKTILGGK
ncbi:MAG: hypothetical protein PHV13_00835 [Candidatus ainarchaeum sp.]|nr:hypothetical protein [Candidatus ainarchaeum sp.]